MQSSIFQEVKNYFLRGTMLSRLIAVNIAVFIIASLINLFFFLMALDLETGILIHFLGISSNPNVIITKPWTLITYMFTHFGFFHILFNMIVLYVGGRLFSQYIGEKRLLGTYLLGGLMGAMFFVISYNLFPAFQEITQKSVAIGASASVIAVFVAIATYMPNFQLPLILLGSIKLKYIAIVFVLVDLISIDKGNSGGHIAHLGGAMWGFLYVSVLKKGIDPSMFINHILHKIKLLFKPKPKMYASYNKHKPLNDDEYNKQKAENQKEVDKILDKISKYGYDSLTKKEKELLFKKGK